MGRPIKISDTLYDRLKDQAEAQGLSLQDALIELLAEPHAAIAGFEKQLDRVRAGASEHLMREKQISSEIGRVREEISALSKKLAALEKTRDRDVEVHNSWTETWEQIPTLARDVNGLFSRVDDLERLSHRHVWQAVEDE